MSTNSIGQILREARERKQLGLDAVTKATKIHARILRALEEDTIDAVINPVYARSFLRSYARYLGLDANELIDRYTDMHPVMPEPVVNIEKVTKRDELKRIRERIRVAGRLARRIAGIAVGIAVVYLALFVAVRVAGFLVHAVKNTAASISQQHRAASQERARKKPAEKKAPKKARSKEEQKETPIVRDTSEPIRMIIKTTDDVWLQVKVDGKTVFTEVLPRGQSKQWVANDRFTIWTGKGESMEIILNETYLGSPGGGVLKGITVDRNGITMKR